MINEQPLMDLAKSNGIRIAVRVASGDFVLAGQTLACADACEDKEKLGSAIRTAIRLEAYRGEVDDIRFSLRILLEIALRALSPGINDSFTAMTCADRIAAALVRPMSEGLRGDVRCDADGVARLIVPGLSLEELFNMTLHPLRQASQGNMLMLHHLARVLDSLHAVAGKEGKKLIRAHGGALLATARAGNPIPEDMAFLQRHMTFDPEIPDLTK